MEQDFTCSRRTSKGRRRHRLRRKLALIGRIDIFLMPSR
jgi:hypothetical protein